jgi:hypothetical protein
MSALLAWLEINIVAPGTTHEVFEVQEDFALGLGEVTRSRAAERALTGAKEGMHAINNAAQEVDTKLRISERASATATAVKESTAMRNTAAALSRAGTSMKKAVESEPVQSGVKKVSEMGAKLGEGFRSLSMTLSSKVGRKTENGSGDLGGGGDGGGTFPPPDVDYSSTNNPSQYEVPDEAPEFVPPPVAK